MVYCRFLSNTVLSLAAFLTHASCLTFQPVIMVLVLVFIVSSLGLVAQSMFSAHHGLRSLEIYTFL